MKINISDQRYIIKRLLKD